jgi:hypothetical protein
MPRSQVIRNGPNPTLFKKPRNPPTKTIPLKTLLTEGYISVGSDFRWIRSQDPGHVGKVTKDGLVAWKDLVVSPSDFCKQVAIECGRPLSVSISGHEQGVIGGVHLYEITNRYRLAHGIPVSKSGRVGSKVIKMVQKMGQHVVNENARITEDVNNKTRAIDDKVEEDRQTMSKMNKMLEDMNTKICSTAESVKQLQGNVSDITKKVDGISENQDALSFAVNDIEERQNVDIENLKRDNKRTEKKLRKLIMIKHEMVNGVQVRRSFGTKFIEIEEDKLKGDHYKKTQNKDLTKAMFRMKVTSRFLKTYHRYSKENPVNAPRPCFLILDDEHATLTKLLQCSILKPFCLLVPNNTKSYLKLKEFQAQKHVTFIPLAQDIDAYLSSDIEHAPFQGVWLDGESFWQKSQPWFDKLFDFQHLSKNRTSLAITWHTTRGGGKKGGGTYESEWNDIDNVNESIIHKLEQCNWTVISKPKYSRYGSIRHMYFWMADIQCNEV